MNLIHTFTHFQIALLFSVLPGVFIFLWTLIVGDLKNFMGSQKAYSEFSAKDPMNCYQNFQLNGSNRRKCSSAETCGSDHE